MRVMVLGIGCPCGGQIDRLAPEDPLQLTEKGDFLLIGICNKCSAQVRWSKHLHELILLCPLGKDTKVQ